MMPMMSRLGRGLPMAEKGGRNIRRHGILILAVLLCLVVGACSEQENEDDAKARQLATARKLNSLPYVSSVKVRQENLGLRGVVKHEAEAAYQGLNLYGSLTRSEAHLRTMEGDLVHTWSAEGVFSNRQNFPAAAGTLEQIDEITPGLIIAELHGEHLLAIEAFSGLVKLDAASQVVFALHNNAHHDLDVAADGSIYVLTSVPRRVETSKGDIIMMDDVIERVSPTGEVEQRFSLFEILAQDEATRPALAKGIQFAQYWFDNMEQWRENKVQQKPEARAAYEALFRLYDEAFGQRTRTLTGYDALYVLHLTPADILHSNTIAVLEGRDDDLWAAGNILVSVRNLDLIVVLDLKTSRVVWSWGPGVVSRQHQPSQLANGNLLVFDNGTKSERSRVIEVDPATKEIVWTYGDRPESRFFSAAMGGAQGLPNGNVLITDSSAGRAFEVERNGHIVWDFFNPAHGYNPFDKGTGDEVIESIYRLVRLETTALDFLPPAE